MARSGTRAGRFSPLRERPGLPRGARADGIVLVPIVFVVLGGFRTTGQIAADPLGLPDPWVSDNYGT